MSIISKGFHHVENIAVEDGVSHDSALGYYLLIVEGLQLFFGG